MLTQEAIALLSQAQSISAANEDVRGALESGAAVAFLPKEYMEHDLERFQSTRRRARGAMSTQSLQDFAAYVAAHAEEGASVFVDQAAMRATAVLNLGKPAAPGHADNTAVFAPKKTAAYAALLSVIRTDNGRSLTQTQLAEWMEDWSERIDCERDGDAIATPKAIAAVRAITVESARKVESVEQTLSAERTAFESIKADSKNQPLPGLIHFTCEPYLGFEGRTFALRVAVHPSEKSVTLSLRMAQAEKHEEEIAAELAAKVGTELTGTAPVMLGTYLAK
jgi:uncharacterized protein YfdQ (DUF2303 family)